MSNLIPVSRKEQYLSKIDGMTNKSPDKTYTKEEYFFSEILGEALHKPVLETRYEMYLAKIAGREIGIPYPETRLERFLAKAAGMNISVPTPITREEMYWSTYSPFYLSNSSGTSPLTYGKCKIGTLSNYRIYGNTVSGESVGDRTGNLFDGEFLQGYCAYADGTRNNTSLTWITTSKLPCKPNTDYSFKSSYIGRYFGFVWFDSNGEYISSSYVSDTSSNMYVNFSSLSPVDAAYLIINIKSHYNTSTGDSFVITPSDVTDLMLNSGSTALPYEPYGYKVPVTVEGKNLFDENSLISPISGFSWYFNDEHYLLATNKSSDNRPWGYNYSQLHITLSPGTYTVQLSGVGANSQYSEIRVFESNNNIIYSENIANKTNIVITFTLNTPKTIGIEIKLYDGKYRFMLNEGTTPLPYEPYHAPVTTPIYLPEQIRKVGDEAEYISYAEQKMYRIGADDLDVTLPTLPTVTGTNVLSVGTEVQPSHIFAEFDKEREYG